MFCVPDREELRRSTSGGLTYTASISRIWKVSEKSRFAILWRVAEEINLRLIAFTRRYLSTWYRIMSRVVETSVRFEKNDSFFLDEFSAPLSTSDS